jgi:hypothetical protein
MTAPNTVPLPNINQPAVQPQTGTLTTAWYRYLSAFDAAVRALVQSSAGSLSAGGGVLTGGFLQAPFVIPTPAAGGSITPNPSSGLKQQVTNNGPFSIIATQQVGDIELLIVNGASAGTITFSGFSKQWTGDTLDATPGHQFVVFIYGLPNKRSAFLVRALQ